MTVTVLFIQGAAAYDEDAKLAASLRTSLGDGYRVVYPHVPGDDNPKYSAWKNTIEQGIAAAEGPIVLAGHSLGGSSLLKYLTENTLKKPILGVFSVATPYWNAKDKDLAEYALRDDATLPVDLPVFLYQARDDEEVDFSHLARYADRFPQVKTHAFETGGHQVNDDLSAVAADIRHLIAS